MSKVGGWAYARVKSPVQIKNSSFYTEAEILESRLRRIDTGRGDSAFTDLIEYNVKLDNVIGDIISEIYRVKDDVEEFEELGEVMFRLIELNLASYRSVKIEDIIEENANRRAGPSGGNAVNAATVKLLQSNMLRLLDVLKRGISDANEGFQEVEDTDNEVVYLGLLAKSIESRLRQYTDFDSGPVEQFLGFMSDVESDEDIADELEEIDDIDETMKEVENDLENI